MIMLTNEEQAALRKKYFPRVTWTERGPVRRVYSVQAVTPGADVVQALIALAQREWFIEPGQRAVVGDADQTLSAFQNRATDKTVGMVFGTELEAHWCDIALSAPDAEGWQTMIVRSEEGENLIALAHNEGLLRFRRASI
jgi:hypothetical protein